MVSGAPDDKRSRLAGQVDGRDTGDGANFATCVVFFVFLLFLTRTKRRKMAVFEGCPVGWRGGTHRSWPGGRGGRPRALISKAGWVSGQGGGAGVQGLRFRGGRW